MMVAIRYLISDGCGRLIGKSLIPSEEDVFVKEESFLLLRAGVIFLLVYLLLFVKKKQKHFGVHRLVLMTFKGMPTKKRCECNHINGIKTDNRIENLEWCSRKENIRHSYRIGLSKRGEDHGRAKLKEKDVLMVIELLKRDVSIKEISKRLKISAPSISQINTGRNWSHLSSCFPISKKTNRGENHYKTKLKEKDVVEIKKLLRNKKLKQTEIGRMFNVSGDDISQIKMKTRWSHIS